MRKNQFILMAIVGLAALSFVVTGCTDNQDTFGVQETVSQSSPEIDSTNTATIPDADATNSTEPSTALDDAYTLADVALHADSSDCWIAIDGSVYDVTDYIPSHPGGSFILQGCGKDGTDLFENRPDGSGSHSEQARNLLQNYYIGDLQ